ncbi:MAG: Uma2 family endonuclease, partial [Treponema sp.]|nr:Uma2 family endonuclease [Treponema sp.]
MPHIALVYAVLMAYTIIMADALLKENTYDNWTYADYKAWELKPGERYEIIDGEAFAMSAPNAYHQSILTELLKQIANFLTGKECKVYPAPYDVRLFYEEDESDDTVVQPDISVVCDKEKRGKEGCRGAPDFVAEILSPSNTAIEMQRKFNVYRDAGVREYWVLDTENKTLTVYLFEDEKAISRSYGEKESVPVAVLEGLS